MSVASIGRVRVAVLYNAPALPAGHPDAASEADVVAVADAVASALCSEGFAAEPLAAGPPVRALVDTLNEARPDVVFNLIEGFGGCSGGEAHVTSLLELLGLPYTGCPPEAQALCRHKGATKALLKGLGLPTAPFTVLEPAGAKERKRLPRVPAFPVIVKPESEDASLGIDQASVVTTAEALAARVDFVRERYGPRVLVESFLPGREFNIGLLALPEPQALPVAEVLYQTQPGDWPLLSYAAKWATGSASDRATPVRCPAEVEPSLARKLRALAVRAFQATGCRDYARVDFRLDARGRPMILEVNPNPDIGPGAGWARALGVSGPHYSATLAALARQALARAGP